MGKISTKISTYTNFIKNLADIAIKIREKVKSILGTDIQNSLIHKIFTQFKNHTPNMDIETFSDNFAQIFTYNLFFIKVIQKKGYNMDNFSTIISNFNLNLKIFFEYLLQEDETVKIEIIKLDQLMKVTNVNKIFQDFNQQNHKQDPITYFYELFLKEYDPKQKLNRGVFYTPDPIVSFIIRSVDFILQSEFDCPDGIADTSSISINPKENVKIPKVQILDPATGTGTFLIHVIAKIKQIFDKKYADLEEKQIRRRWNEYVSIYLLPKIFGFEVMMAPYAIANLKIRLKLVETGYDFKSNQKLEIYLNNALQAHSNTIKTKNSILVIIGNPPYVVNSINNTPYIRNLMQIYKEEVKEEKYIKPLSDDYIKFIRLAHNLIEKTSVGIIGMVTNHGYLSGLIHRGMRKELLHFFDKVYILDLHGNSNIGEICPDGSEDQNVFNIQQGVAISFFVKLPKCKPQPKVYHLDLWGDHVSKYQFLETNDISTISWNELNPKPPNFFFIPYDLHLSDEYNSFISLKDIFKLQRIGILTNRDWLTIDFSFEELKQKIQRFFGLLDQRELLHNFPQLKNTWWDYKKLKNLKIQTIVKSISKCLFRPFDIRYIIYHPLLLNRARIGVMDHINNKDNLVLITSRHYRKNSFNSCFISEYIVEQKAGESTRGSYVFPLYSYYNGKKEPNLTSLAKHYFDHLNKQLDALAIMGYIYAILHSNSYRTRYQEYLKLDFPRIPITNNKALFAQLSSFGQELIKLHLLKNEMDSSISFCGNGNNLIQKGYPKFKNNSIYINRTQWFQGISPNIWSFIIGGYQVCYKWLKNRKGRNLTDQEIINYQKIISSISETIRIINKIDNKIEVYGGWPLKL